MTRDGSPTASGPHDYCCGPLPARRELNLPQLVRLEVLFHPRDGAIVERADDGLVRDSSR